jgi:predicted PurR-regulated permease PerM
VTSVALGFCFLLFRPFIYQVISALVIGIIFAPVHNKLERRISSPGLAAATSTFLVVLVVALPAALILLALSQELAQLREVIQQRSADSGGLAAYAQSLIERPMGWLSRYVDTSNFDVRAFVLNKAKEIGTVLVAGGAAIVGSAASFIVSAAISLFTLFFIFREGKGLKRRVLALLPLTTAQSDKLFKEVENTIVGTVYGGLVIAAVQGALVGLALWFLDFHSPVLWGVVAAFAALIPLVGTALVWVPAVLFLVAVGSWGWAIGLAAFCAIGVGGVDNILRPLLLSGRVEMHTLLIFFAVFGGVNVFGFLGLIIGPVIVAVTATLLRMLRDEGREWVTAFREAEEGVVSADVQGSP